MPPVPPNPPSPRRKGPDKTIEQIIDEVGVYPLEAYDFVQRGLHYTVTKVHESTEPGTSHHVSGQQLCEGLREYARGQYGMMARAVLQRWNITSTLDFGRIVFAMIDGGMMSKTDHDRIDDFRAVYDFAASMDADYVIELSQ